RLPPSAVHPSPPIDPAGGAWLGRDECLPAPWRAPGLPRRTAAAGEAEKPEARSASCPPRPVPARRASEGQGLLGHSTRLVSTLLRLLARRDPRLEEGRREVIGDAVDLVLELAEEG